MTTPADRLVEFSAHLDTTENMLIEFKERIDRRLKSINDFQFSNRHEIRSAKLGDAKPLAAFAASKVEDDETGGNLAEALDISHGICDVLRDEYKAVKAGKNISSPMTVTLGAWNAFNGLFRQIDILRQNTPTQSVEDDHIPNLGKMVEDDELVERFQHLMPLVALFDDEGSLDALQAAITRLQSQSERWVKIEDIPDEWKQGRYVDLTVDGQRFVDCKYLQDAADVGYVGDKKGWVDEFNLWIDRKITHAMLPIAPPKMEG